ncbi:MAG: heavy-metal-associated domain-containing protein [Planctomycetota bacterium]|jgi:copper chaperone CopZ
MNKKLQIRIFKTGDNYMMRYVFALLVLLTSFFCGTGCNSVEQDLVVDSTEGSETRVYEVFGMNCPGCHGGLEKLVKRISAVQDAEANWQKKQLVVMVRPEVELNDEDIYEAIRRANFTPGERIK